MEKRTRIWLKTIILAALTLLFIWLVYTDEKVLQLKQPEGEMVRAEEVLILLGELKEAGAEPFDEAGWKELEELFQGQETEFVKYENYRRMLEVLSDSEEDSRKEGKWKGSLTYKNKYRNDFFLLKKDWYNCYRKLLEIYGLEKEIREEKIELLCGGQNLAGEKKIEEGCLLDKDGKIYVGTGREFSGLQFISVKAFVRENRLLTLTELLPDKSVLPNVWIMEEEGKQICFFYKGYEILADMGELSLTENAREQIGDIAFAKGTIEDVRLKKERVSGKLLGISEEEAEIEGYGRIPMGDDCIGYQLYEGLREADRGELALGYDFTDFVLDGGEICAFLIARKEKMETIRVAIKNNHFSDLYHDRIVLAGENAITVTYGEYGSRETENLEAGEELVIEPGSKYLSGGRIEVAPNVNTGKIRVRSLERSQGTPAYRGKMEIVQTEKGLALINEVLMEEYLYSVTPSEMPSSYPIEALKAQAVCARTYGYRHLLHPGYADLGAHMDDSVSYQVYNNIAENINTTKAVKETAGTLLLYDDEPVTTYYYSTSCGFGADAGVWNGDQKEEFPYLRACHIAREADDGTNGRKNYSAKELAQEDNFRDYIFRTDEDAYEKEEKWFRWHYHVDELDPEILWQKLKERYAAVPSKVLTLMEEGEVMDGEAYEEKEPGKFSEIYEIQCLSRRDGGVMDELFIVTDRGKYKIISEYNIRYILNQGGEAEGQDGTVFACTALLPSAYFAIDVVKEGEIVIGYTLIGGGYGHGVGMSQNGARAMGTDGMEYGSILSFYFEGCRLDKIY